MEEEEDPRRVLDPFSCRVRAEISLASDVSRTVGHPHGVEYFIYLFIYLLIDLTQASAYAGMTNLNSTMGMRVTCPVYASLCLSILWMPRAHVRSPPRPRPTSIPLWCYLA